MPDVQRSCRVGRDEFEIDRLPGEHVVLAVRSPLLDDGARERPGRGSVEPDVQKPRPGDLGARDPVDRRQRRSDGCRELARIQPEALAEPERDVRRPIAVIAVTWTLERHIVGLNLVGPAARRRPDGVEQRRGQFGGIHNQRSYRAGVLQAALSGGG